MTDPNPIDADTSQAEVVQDENTDLLAAAFAAMDAKSEQDIAALKQAGITERQLNKLLNGAEVCGEIKIVDFPQGRDTEEKCGVFKQVFVRQWSVGDSGDSFEGFIYGKLPNGKWLQVRYAFN